MDITEELQKLKGLRKEAREQKLNFISNGFYNYLKKYNYSFFRKSLLNSFFPSEFDERTKQRITKDILKNLMLSGKIEKDKTSKSYHALVNKPLEAIDFNSYNILMKRNGYKTFYYNWVYDEKQKIPKKVLIGKSDINQKVNFDFDFSEIRTNKQRSKEAVYQNSVFSIIKKEIKQDVISFRVN